MKIAKELNNFIRFKELDQTKKEIIFYSEDEESFYHFKGIINYLTVDFNKKITYITSQSDDAIFAKDLANVDVFYFNKLLPNVIKNLKAKALVMTMPDIDLFHIKRSKYGTNHIYIFHNIGSSFPVIRFGALFNYDTLFCVGQHHKVEIKKQEDLYNLKTKTLVDFGYHKLELIKKQYDDYNKKSDLKNNRTKNNILLAPTWGENSILNFCGIRLINTLLGMGYNITVRPHPMTFKKSKNLINKLIKLYGGNENFILEENISSTKSFYDADIFITDWSGVAYEYAFGTERPILFIDVPQKVINTKYKELGIEPIDINLRYNLGKVLKLEDIDRIDVYINDLILNKDQYAKTIKKTRNEMIYNFGSSSKIGADYIASLIEMKQ